MKTYWERRPEFTAVEVQVANKAELDELLEQDVAFNSAGMIFQERNRSIHTYVVFGEFMVKTDRGEIYPLYQDTFKARFEPKRQTVLINVGGRWVE